MSTFPSDTPGKSTALVCLQQAAGSFPTGLYKISEPAGRVLLSILFLISGLGKLGAYEATAAYMASAGVPAALLPVVIATELVGAVAIVLGWQTRIAAFLLAGHSLLAAFYFHINFDNPVETVMFLKNVSIAGGLLLLVANGAGPLSLDRRAGR